MGTEVGRRGLVDGKAGETQTPNMAPTVADALRDLSTALVRLADTRDEAN